MPREVKLAGEWITVSQLLKWVGAAETGGQAKLMIGGGMVKVNGLVETRRGRKLRPGDTIEISGVAYLIT